MYSSGGWKISPGPAAADSGPGKAGGVRAEQAGGEQDERQKPAQTIPITASAGRYPPAPAG